MTLEDLRILVAVCEASSLSEIARRLRRTQPAVSQHIAKLEREVGVALFERRARGVEPTEAGRALRDAARDALDALGQGLKQVGELRDGDADSVTITTGGTTVRHFLKDAIVSFQRSFPEVELRFVLGGSTTRCLELLRTEQCDLALVTIGEELPRLEQWTICRQRLYLLTSRNDPLAQRRRINVGDLEAIQYIGLPRETTSRALIEEHVEGAGYRLRSKLTVDDFDTASVFAELGLGHAIVPALQAHNLTRRGGLRSVPIHGLPVVPIGWACRRWSALRRPARDFASHVRRGLSKMGKVPGLAVVDPPIEWSSSSRASG